MPEPTRGRKDHILPVGYLEGFTETHGLLQVFQIKEQRWFTKRPDGVGYKPGFYDYSEGVKPDQTADQAFREYEGQFPELRRELIASNFANWRKHLDFLLRYINMFWVRSELFRGEHRRYLPSEVFLGRLSHLMIRKPVRTADGRVPATRNARPKNNCHNDLCVHAGCADARKPSLLSLYVFYRRCWPRHSRLSRLSLPFSTQEGKTLQTVLCP